MARDDTWVSDDIFYNLTLFASSDEDLFIDLKNKTTDTTHYKILSEKEALSLRDWLNSMYPPPPLESMQNNTILD